MKMLFRTAVIGLFMVALWMPVADAQQTRSRLTRTDIENRLNALEQPVTSGQLVEVTCNGSGTPLQDAVNQARPGIPLTINVAGSCVENVDIQADDVTINGVSQGSTTITAASTTDATIDLVGARRFTLQNVTVSGGHTESTPESDEANAVLARDGSSSTLQSVTVTKASKSGVVVTSGSTANLVDVTMKDNVRHGVYVERNGYAEVSGATLIEQNGGYGMAVSFNASSIVDGALIRDNGIDGVVISRHSHVTLKNSTVENNTGRGIFLLRSSQANVDTSTIQGNGERGIFAWRSSQVEMTNSTVQNNTAAGVKASQGSQADIFSSTVQNNGGRGFEVQNSSHASIDESTVQNNQGDEIQVSNGSALELEESVVTHDAGTIGSQTEWHYAIIANDNSNVDINQGNTITSNVESSAIGSTLLLLRGSNATIRGGEFPEVAGNRFNRIVNTAPVNSPSDGNPSTAGGMAISAHSLSGVRIDFGHTVIQGNINHGELSVMDLRDVAITGNVFGNGEKLRFRDQGTVPGNITITGGNVYSHHHISINSDSEQPTFDGDINCMGGPQPASPIFINDHGFVNCQ